MAVIFIVVGLIIATFFLFFKSGNTSTLGSSLSIMGDKNEDSLSVCPSVIVDSTGYFRGWPYGAVSVSVYDSPEDYTIAKCQGVNDEVYPLSFFANMVIFSSISGVVYVLFRELKKKGAKNGQRK